MSKQERIPWRWLENLFQFIGIAMTLTFAAIVVYRLRDHFSPGMDLTSFLLATLVIGCYLVIFGYYRTGGLGALGAMFLTMLFELADLVVPTPGSSSDLPTNLSVIFLLVCAPFALYGAARRSDARAARDEKLRAKP